MARVRHTRTHQVPADSQLLDLIEALLETGHHHSVMLGLDLRQRDYFRAYGGGPGLAYLMSTFVPRLHRRIGVPATTKMLVENPARAFAWVIDADAAR